MRDIPANIGEIAFPVQSQWFLPYVSRNTKSYTRSGFLNIYDSPESQETFIVLLTRSDFAVNRINHSLSGRGC